MLAATLTDHVSKLAETIAHIPPIIVPTVGTRVINADHMAISGA
jgi:hypothetical protein